jgi:hypothetical protein
MARNAERTSAVGVPGTPSACSRARLVQITSTDDPARSSRSASLRGAFPDHQRRRLSVQFLRQSLLLRLAASVISRRRCCESRIAGSWVPRGNSLPRARVLSLHWAASCPVAPDDPSRADRSSPAGEPTGSREARNGEQAVGGFFECLRGFQEIRGRSPARSLGRWGCSSPAVPACRWHDRRYHPPRFV